MRTRKLIIKKYLEGDSLLDIANRYDMRVKTIKSYVDRYFYTGTTLSEFELTKKHGKQRKKQIFDNPDLSEFVLNECLTDPTKSLETYEHDIYGQFGIYVSKDTIDRYFKKLGWKWKRISRVAMEVDLEEEYLFMKYMKEIVYDEKMLVFFDESNRNDITANPTYGRGQGRVYVPVHFRRGTYKLSLSILSWSEGILASEACFGSVNEDKFNDFVIHEMIHHLNPYPGPRSVLAIDNIGFHHNELFQNVITEIGTICAYLPHYDPFYNLTEYVFRDIKSIEAAKCVYGEREAVISLAESVEKVKNKKYAKILKDIGYI